MGSLGSAYQNKVLDAVFGAGLTKPATVWVALYTVAPTSVGGGTEVTGGSYARVSVTNNTTNWPNAASGSKSNGVAFTFPTATAGWGTIVAFGIHDTAATDSLVTWGLLGTSVTVASGDSATFGIGSLTITAS